MDVSIRRPKIVSLCTGLSCFATRGTKNVSLAAFIILPVKAINATKRLYDYNSLHQDLNIKI